MGVGWACKTADSSCRGSLWTHPESAPSSRLPQPGGRGQVTHPGRLQKAEHSPEAQGVTRTENWPLSGLPSPLRLWTSWQQNGQALSPDVATGPNTHLHLSTYPGASPPGCGSALGQWIWCCSSWDRCVLNPPPRPRARPGAGPGTPGVRGWSVTLLRTGHLQTHSDSM